METTTGYRRRDATGLAVALLGLLTACISSGPPVADRLFADGDLVAARQAYVAFLESHPADDAEAARARYHLAVLYALPGETNDWPRAVRELERLLELHPGTVWADQGALLLSLHNERQRLAMELSVQQGRANRLTGQLTTLQNETERASIESSDSQARIENLAADIDALRRRIGELTRQLGEREAELEQLKRIDLETPP
jgi:hypothetical protein